MHQAERDVDNFINQESHVVLYHGGQPVGMSGFNARLPDIVQIGAVFTPKPLRGQGYARRAVALQLDRARSGGVTRAVLFAASSAAAAAYRAIGFQRAGSYALVLFSNTQQVPQCH